jgi:hypothetical protein
LPIVRGNKSGRKADRHDNKAFSRSCYTPAITRFGKKTAAIASGMSIIGNSAGICGFDKTPGPLKYIVLSRYYLLTG